MNHKSNHINHQQKQNYEQQQAMLRWLNRNRQILLDSYKNRNRPRR